MPKKEGVALPRLKEPPKSLCPAAFNHGLKAKCQVCDGLVCIPRDPNNNFAIMKTNLCCCRCGQRYYIDSTLDGWQLEEMIRGKEARGS